MSNAKKCDRCGGYYDNESYKPLVTMVRLPRGIYSSYDFCEKCHDKLIRWLNKHQQVIEVDHDR